MNLEQFEALVRQIEQSLKPRSLQKRVVLWATVGYAGFLSWFALVFGLASLFLVPAVVMGWSAWFLMVLGAGVLVGGLHQVTKILWVRPSPPSGITITRQEAPVLYELLDSLQREVQSAPFHQVLLIQETNAAVVQQPRLGVLGWWQNYLLLGLPLMEALAPEEFRAVLAHELAHLSRRHGRQAHGLYRLRRSWERVFAQLNRPQAAGSLSLRPLIIKFVEWFWPRFNAHAFVLSRHHEYEADALAARLTSTQASASALLRLQLQTRLIDERFWHEFWLEANHLAAPPTDIYLRLRKVLAEGPGESQKQLWCEEAFRVITTNGDTHPCLRDRLRALHGLTGAAADQAVPACLIPYQVSHSAAVVLLGGAHDKLRLLLEAAWRKDHACAWHDRHARSKALHDRLQHLKSALPTPNLDLDALWDKARLVTDLQGEESALPLLQQILLLRPGHAPAHFCLGRHLLGKNDPAGKNHLERAMAEDEDLVAPGCDLLFQFHRFTGNNAGLQAVRARLDAHQTTLADSRLERSSVSPNDPLIPHGLTEEELSGLRLILNGEPDLSDAFLARKELRHFPRQRLYLLCVNTRAKWGFMSDGEKEQALVKRLCQGVKLPGRMLIFAPRNGFRLLGLRLARFPNSRLHP